MKISKFKRVLKTIRGEFLINQMQAEYFLYEVLKEKRFKSKQRFTVKQILNDIEILITGQCKKVRS